MSKFQSIQNFNLSKNVTFEINALIEKLFFLLELNHNSQIYSTIIKMDTLTKQVSGSYSNFIYIAMKTYACSNKQ